MASFFYYLTPVLMVVVAIVLGMGLWNMAKGGSSNRSQTLMRARVLFQAIAVLAMVAAVYFISGRN